MNQDGTEHKPLLMIIDVGNLKGKAATWSPNGKRIVYSAYQHNNWDV